MNKNVKKYLNLGFFVAMVVVNILAATGVLGGITTKAVSDRYASYLTPVPMSFGIWSVIYVLVGFVVLYQMFKSEVMDKLGNLFMLSCIANIAWIFTWQYNMIGLSFVCIVALLLLLLFMMYSIDSKDLKLSIPIGIYAGWINVATLANLGVWYTKMGWRLFGMADTTWAVIALAAGILLMGFIILTTRNGYYSFAAAWAYLGISMAWPVNVVGTIAMIGTIILVLLGLLSLILVYDKSCMEKKCCSRT